MANPVGLFFAGEHGILVLAPGARNERLQAIVAALARELFGHQQDVIVVVGRIPNNHVPRQAIPQLPRQAIPQFRESELLGKKVQPD